jgi:MFS family permease
LFCLCSAFGSLPADLNILMAGAAMVGFFLNSTITGIYSVVPVVFPAGIRTTGTGFAMSIGRAGAATGPYVAGLLIGQQMSRPIVFIILACPMLLAAVSLIWIRDRNVVSGSQNSETNTVRAVAPV